MSILITGYSGFIGKSLVGNLANRPLHLVGRSQPSSSIHSFFRKQLNSNENYLDCLNGVNVVVHTAAIAHINAVNNPNLVLSYHSINVDATLNLAYQAANANVKRFIFISSIGVNGISNSKAFTADDKPNPVEDYAFSKLNAEIGLRKIALQSGMELVIIRPPLVYGPLAPGNFGKLANLSKKNWPLPFGAINNKRSFVGLDNLVDLIITCIDHPKAANQTFLVSDDHDVSTTELLQMMIRAAGKTPRLLPVPERWLKFAGKLIGKQAVVDRLCGNLQVDITHTKETLNWTPPISMEEGIRRCFVKEDLC